MTGPIIGIDIGSQGAIALLTPAGDLLEVVDMPILRDGPKGRPNVSAALLADIVVNMKASTAFVEFVGARPGEGAAGAFAFGRSRGVDRGRLRARQGFPSRSDACALEAARRDPRREGRRERRRSIAGSSPLAWRMPRRSRRVKDDGRAEAL